MLEVANVLFFVGHDLLIVFNLCGWIWPATRRWHLATLSATLFSWLVMGAWRGWGYCACTDAHFALRRQLGIQGQETSYIQLALHRLPGVEISRSVSDVLAVGGLLLILVATACVWWGQWRNQRAGNADSPVSATDEP